MVNSGVGSLSHALACTGASENPTDPPIHQHAAPQEPPTWSTLYNLERIRLEGARGEGGLDGRVIPACPPPRIKGPRGPCHNRHKTWHTQGNMQCASTIVRLS